MKRYVFIIVTFLWVALGLLYFPTDGQCFQVDFQGRMESNFVLRDTDGFQHGFLDSNKGVQWRNTLKFDLALRPEHTGTETYRLDKVFMSYRGAYDAIFELTDRYDTLEDKSPDDFEYGKDDIEWENDLREAFVDLVAVEGNTNINLRIGRQIVQWGEADGFNLVNIVCPDDFSHQMFFSAIEDTATPLWMARLNYTSAGVGFFDSMGLELLAIPDIRPDQFAPMTDRNGNWTSVAPYAVAFTDFDGFGDTVMTGVDAVLSGIIPGYTSPVLTPAQQIQGALKYREDVADEKFENMEYGLSLSLSKKDLLTTFHYFVGHQDEPAVNTADANRFGLDYLNWAGFGVGSFPDGPTAVFTHPRQRTLGLTWNYFVEPLNLVFRGEGSRTNRAHITYLNNSSGISDKVVYQGLVGVDMTPHLPWIGTRTPLSTSIQGYWRHVSGLDDNEIGVQTGTRAYAQDLQDSYRITLTMYTDYRHGEIFPQIFAMYDPEGCWMTNALVKYTPSNNWQFVLSEQSFWGNDNGISPFAQGSLINTSELSFKVIYRF